MTATYDIGDSVLLTFTVLNSAGSPTNATVALTLTDPDGTTSTPAVSTAATGVYTATVAPTSGRSTKTTSPRASWAKSVIPTRARPSSRRTHSWSEE